MTRMDKIQKEIQETNEMISMLIMGLAIVFAGLLIGFALISSRLNFLEKQIDDIQRASQALHLELISDDIVRV